MTLTYVHSSKTAQSNILKVLDDPFVIFCDSNKCLSWFLNIKFIFLDINWCIKIIYEIRFDTYLWFFIKMSYKKIHTYLQNIWLVTKRINVVELKVSYRILRICMFSGANFPNGGFNGHHALVLDTIHYNFQIIEIDFFLF